MINTKKQAFYTIFIVIGAVILIYDLSTNSEEVYLKIVGLVLLMFGLYSSTRQWASDNPKEEQTKAEIEEMNGEAETDEAQQK